MREILFKAQRTDNKEWVEGVPVDVTPLTCFGELPTEVVIVRAGFADWGMPRGLEGCKVDPETICQYTGKNDKNDSKIFEGDIARFAYFEHGEMCWVGEVKFENCQFIVEGDSNKECESDFFICLSGIPPHRIEIIGNIHDKEDSHEH